MIRMSSIQFRGILGLLVLACLTSVIAFFNKKPDVLLGAGGIVQTAEKKPNILFIMGDDIGWMQPSVYHRGLMVGETPNIDRIGQEGAIFMDYVAMQSCTSGRNAFFTGMYPLRTGMIPPQLPGSPSYLLPGTPALAKFLHDLGYTTGEFGKNHLGDHTAALPTAHGFQEFWGYLYHLDAMQQVSFPDINKTPTEQGIAPPCRNTPIPGVAEVPGAAVASDQGYREADLAIDYCEDVPPLGAPAVDRIVGIMREAGMTAKVSSIHVNGWFGEYDKLGMTRTLARERFATDLDARRAEYVFVGDSPNDAPLFAYFPHSVGVANVRRFAGRVDAWPAYVTRAAAGAGFAEVADRVLAAPR